MAVVVGDMARWRQAGLETRWSATGPSVAWLGKLSLAIGMASGSSVAIDGIFTTSGVPVLASGYNAFGKFVEADHWALWIDINLNTALGNFKPQESTFKPLKLTLLDRQSVRRYLQLVHLGYKEYDIPSHLTRLNQRIENNERQMSPLLAHKYNCLHWYGGLLKTIVALPHPARFCGLQSCKDFGTN
ncbi:unnamed protein product [Cylindrotheca closterium]|uniref:Uncharacterized protein n=1 Tax=Cylindrotheca closterium TaxID=2856 RepID=A0AAD2GDH7_9STRA|nr:unnamed protein product [Cylindrotheca closterium]